MRVARLMAVVVGGKARRGGPGRSSDVSPDLSPLLLPPGWCRRPAGGHLHIGRAWAVLPTTADCEQSYKVACYEPCPNPAGASTICPHSTRRAIDGKGTTIVIVDSFGSPTIKK